MPGRGGVTATAPSSDQPLGSWYLYGPDSRLQCDIAGTLRNGIWNYIVGTYDKDAGADNQRLHLKAPASRR